MIFFVLFFLVSSVKNVTRKINYSQYIKTSLLRILKE